VRIFDVFDHRMSWAVSATTNGPPRLKDRVFSIRFVAVAEKWLFRSVDAVTVH
jgi:hypothetical protein